jgi:HD superfamily phosphohydrolase
MENYYSRRSDLQVEFEKELGSLCRKESVIALRQNRMVQRLKNVSFFGVLERAASIPEDHCFSRYEHSISVAHLTFQYCQNLRLSRKATLIATLAAYFHDIGSLAFSHSTEDFWNVRYGTGFPAESFTYRIRDILSSSGLKFSDSVYDAILGQSKDVIRNQLFNNPFCPDTFDGINRAFYSLSGVSAPLRDRLGFDPVFTFSPNNPEELVNLVSRNGRPLDVDTNDVLNKDHSIGNFHRTMKYLYENVFYSDWLVASEAMFRRALEPLYSQSKGIGLEEFTDPYVLELIHSNPFSAMLFNEICRKNFFIPLSKKDPRIYIDACLKYEQERIKVGASNVEKKRKLWKKIETYIGEQLGIGAQHVILHEQYPLRWFTENIYLDEYLGVQTGEKHYNIKWSKTEGTPAVKPRIEVYIPGEQFHTNGMDLRLSAAVF